MTELRLAGATTIEEANVVLKDFLERFNGRFGVPAQHVGAGRVFRYGALLQAQSQGGQGQHGEAQVAYLAATAGHGAAQLCRSGGRCAGRAGRSTGGAARGSDHRQSGGATRPDQPPSFKGSSSHGPLKHRGLNGLGRRREATPATLDARKDAGDADYNGAVRVRQASAMSSRAQGTKTTPRDGGTPLSPLGQNSLRRPNLPKSPRSLP